MSQNPRLRRKWLHRAVAVVIVLACYLTVHRATCHYDWGARQEPSGAYTVLVTYRRHWVGDKPFPRWVESIFNPAAELEDLTGCLPDQPTCVLIRPERRG